MHLRALVTALRCALGVAALAACAQASAHPAVWTRDELERSGYVRLADFLQRLPIASGEQNALYNGGGDGRELVDVRQLGARYTLVLVDGRRWPSGDDSSVDLSAIAWTSIERIEIDLAPSIARYGAGAVAGVVNVVTRRDVRGAEARAWSGEYADGDGHGSLAAATLGAGDERTSVVLDVAHDESDPVQARDRAISSVPLFGFSGNAVAAGASSTTPFGRFAPAPGFGSPTLTLVPGRAGTSPGDFRAFDPDVDGYNAAAESYLQAPSERTTLTASARHAFDAALSASFDVAYAERRSRQRFAPAPLAFFGERGQPRISGASLYNPFGVEIARWQYRNTIAPRTFDQDVDTLRASLALDGRFRFGERAFEWDVAWTHGAIEQRDVARGQFDLARLALGVGPSFRDASGTPTCGTPAAPIAGCVPIDVFSGPTAMTPAMVDYAGYTQQSSVQARIDEAEARLAGTVAQLPAGPLALQVGALHRRRSDREQPDAVAALGGTTGAPAPSGFVPSPLAGETTVSELHASIDLPLLADATLARSLDVALAVRATRFGRDGAPRRAPFDEALVLPRREWDDSRTSSAAQFRWQPFDEWLVAAGWSRGYVEPDIEQLFGAQTNVFPVLGDPCSNSLMPPPDVRARCESGFGGVAPVPRGYEEFQDNPARTSGGNPRLDPERTEQRSLGLTWSPAGADATVSLDWFRIRISDQPRLRTVAAVLDDCYVRAIVAACAHITRLPGFGDIDTLFLGWTNAASTESEGYDLAVRRRWRMEASELDIRWDTTYLAYVGDAAREPAGRCLGTPGTFGSCREYASGNQVGNYFDRGFAFHRIRSRIAIDWHRGDWGATATLRHLSGLDSDCNLPDVLGRPERCSNGDAVDPRFGSPSHRFPATWYVDFQAGWDTPWNARVTLGVRNATDRDPPVSYATSDGNFDPEYEVPGRFWYAGYIQRF